MTRHVRIIVNNRESILHLDVGLHLRGLSLGSTSTCCRLVDHTFRNLFAWRKPPQHTCRDVMLFVGQTSSSSST